MTTHSTTSLGRPRRDPCCRMAGATEYRSVGCGTEGSKVTRSPWQLPLLGLLPILENLLPSNLGRRVLELREGGTCGQIVRVNTCTHGSWVTNRIFFVVFLIASFDCLAEMEFQHSIQILCNSYFIISQWHVFHFYILKLRKTRLFEKKNRNKWIFSSYWTSFKFTLLLSAS